MVEPAKPGESRHIACNFHIINYIPDFYTSEKKLIIELDGKVHDFQKEYDKNRDHILKELGLTVLRFKNEEIKGVYSVLENIKMHF